MRDRAIEGLATLARRQDWRSSPDCDVIVARVKAALADENPVVRMSAANAFGALYTDVAAGDRVRMLDDLLNDETDTSVQDVLLSNLGADANTVPHEVDDVLRGFATRTATATDRADMNDDQRGLVVDILTFLAVNHQTPFALS